ncbi:MAG: TolB family protein [Bacillota bacterium]
MRRLLTALLLLALPLTGCRPATPSAPRPPAPMRLAFVRQGDLWLWAGGAERRLTEGGKVHTPRFSHDGRFLAYWQGRRLMLTRTDGKGGPWPVPAARPVHQVSWSPTANRLALSQGDRTATVDVTGTGPTQPQLVVEGWAGATWSPDGEQLAVHRVKTGRHPFEGTAWTALISRTDGEPRVILEDPYSLETAGDRCGAGARPVAFSPDGQWLLLVRPGATPSIAADCNEFLVISTRGGEPKRLGASPNPRWAAWSPAGPTLALTHGAGREAYRQKEILLAAPPWADLRRLTPPGYADREPAWSPGGSYLAFTRSRAERPERTDQPAPGQAIYVTTVESGKTELVPGSEGGFCPSWGQDGTLFWIEPGELHHRRDDLPNPLLSGVDRPLNYYGQWQCSEVLDLWIPAEPYSRP